MKIEANQRRNMVMQKRYLNPSCDQEPKEVF